MKRQSLFIIILFSFILSFSNTNKIIIENLHYKKNFSFIVLGDSRNSIIPNDSIYGHGDSILSKIVKTINTLSDTPLFVIHTGDLSRIGLKKEYERYIKITDSLNMPIITLTGNHELYADSAHYYFKKYFSSSELSFEIGNYLFITLESTHLKRIKNKNYCDYFISKKSLIKLDSLLLYAQENNKFPIIMTHVPPRIDILGYTHHCLGSEEYYPKPNYEKSNIEIFMGLLKYYNVPLAVFGHIHHLDYFQFNNSYYIISGGAGAPLRKEYERGDTINHFLYFSTYDNDSLLLKIINMNGQLIDSFIIKKHFSLLKDTFSLKKENDSLYLSFTNKTIRNIKIKNLFSKIIIDTLITDKEFSMNLKHCRFYKYEIRNANKKFKGMFFNF